MYTPKYVGNHFTKNISTLCSFFSVDRNIYIVIQTQSVSDNHSLYLQRTKMPNYTCTVLTPLALPCTFMIVCITLHALDILNISLMGQVYSTQYMYLCLHEATDVWARVRKARVFILSSKAKYTLTAKYTNRISISQMLLNKCTCFIDHRRVWAPL